MSLRTAWPAPKQRTAVRPHGMGFNTQFMSLKVIIIILTLGFKNAKNDCRAHQSLYIMSMQNHGYIPQSVRRKIAQTYQLGVP